MPRGGGKLLPMRRFRVALGFASLSAAVLSWGAVAPSSQEVPIAIVGARLIDGTGGSPMKDSVVIVAGDRIAAVGSKVRIRIPRYATVVDAAGKFLMPGLVDVQCHIDQPADAMQRYWKAQLRWGVTTMRSGGTDKPETVPLFRLTREGSFVAPRAYTSGQRFAGSAPYPGAPTISPATPDEARASVRTLKAQRVDFIEISMADPKLPPAVITAIVGEAKSAGIPIVVRVSDVASLHQLADLGVTDFVHNPTDQPVNGQLVDYAKSKRLTFAPAMASLESQWFYYEHPEILQMPRLQDALYPRGKQLLADPQRRADALSAPDLAQQKKRMRDQTFPFIKAMSNGGVRVVTGTDCGDESQVTPLGYATHREIQLFVEAGLSPLAAIRAATLDAARVVARKDDPEFGSIRVGKAADLVLLDADPTADINNTVAINSVMRAGRWVE